MREGFECVHDQTSIPQNHLVRAYMADDGSVIIEGGSGAIGPVHPRQEINLTLFEAYNLAQDLLNACAERLAKMESKPK